MARAALGMSLADAAKAAAVGISTVSRFEAGGSSIPATRAALQRAFEDSGVIFLAAGELTDGGPGVRLAAEEADAS